MVRMGVDEAIEQAVGEAIDNADLAEEVAEEIADEVDAESSAPDVVVITEDSGSPVEEVAAALELSEQMRQIAREAAFEAVRLFEADRPVVVVAPAPEPEPVVEPEPAPPEDDTPPKVEHGWFRSRGRHHD